MSDDPKTIVGRTKAVPSFGPYVVEGVLGSGGFGRVYRAVAPDGDRVALKVMTASASADDLERFRREADIRLQHANIVGVLDHGETDQGEHYIVFELVEGETLHERFRAAPLSPAEVVRHATQMCAGLAVAHAQGLVHRDLKPSNVMVTEDGDVKLLDFGIAHSTAPEAGERLTMIGTVVGTPGYLSPEQARGEGSVDARADIWGVGILMYQALTGNQPFFRATSMATILSVVLEEAEPVDTAVALPVALVKIVHRCLRKSPADRYQSAHALAEALRALEVEGGEARSVSSEGDVAAVTASMTLDEQRVLSLLLAEGVTNLPALRLAVEEWGGDLVPIQGHRAIGIFGGRTWEGDETQRAVAAAVQARDATDYVGVASGRASGSGGAVSGSAVLAVEKACATHVAGVAIDSNAARSLVGYTTQRVGDGFEVVVDPKRRMSWALLEAQAEVPLLGREADLAQLETAAATVQSEEHAMVVWVSGPPGIGKSRLRREMSKILQRDGGTTRILAARARSHRRNVAMHVLENLLHGAILPNSGAPAHERRDRLIDYCQDAVGDEALGRDIAFNLGGFLGLPAHTMPSIEDRPSDPQLMADMLRVAVGDLLLGLAAQGPIALLIDDAQWIDGASLEFLTELTLRAAELPLLVFVASRPELGDKHDDLFDGCDLLKVQPRGLIAKQVAVLVEAMAGRPVDAGLARTIADRTGGNPFFVEQIVHELAEQQLFDSAITELPIPLNVEAAVQNRLDHLPTEEKQLCKMASVLGRTFTASGLEALGLRGPLPLLGPLARKGLISRRGHAGREREYAFRNELLFEVAYRMNTDEARAHLHGKAALHLATLPEGDAEEVARHHERGGDQAAAATEYARAATAAVRRGDTPSILRCTERALSLGVAEAKRFDLHMVRADALSFLGRREDQGKELDEAVERADSPLRVARALGERVALLASLGSHDTGARVAEEAVAAARESGSASTLARTLTRQVWVLIYSGRLDEAAPILDEAETLVAKVDAETAALVASWRAQLATALGDTDQRRRAYEQLMSLYRQVGDVRREAMAECNLADTYNRIGAYAEAATALRQAIESCRRVGNRIVEGFALANLGYALTMLGQAEDAVKTLDEAAQVAAAIDNARLAIAIRVYRVRAVLHDLSPDEVVREAEVAADEARRAGMPALSVASLAMAAKAWLVAGNAPMALALSRRAVQIRDEIGAMEEDEIEVFLIHARALLASGEVSAANEVLAQGDERLEQLAARFEDDEWRGRFLNDVPANRELRELARR